MQALNQQRTQDQDVGAGYDRLADIMRCFLDHCLAVHDVDSAKMVMIMVRSVPLPSDAVCCATCAVSHRGSLVAVGLGAVPDFLQDDPGCGS